jgi:hypothetical protein
MIHNFFFSMVFPSRLARKEGWRKTTNLIVVLKDWKSDQGKTFVQISKRGKKETKKKGCVFSKFSWLNVDRCEMLSKSPNALFVF